MFFFYILSKVCFPVSHECHSFLFIFFCICGFGSCFVFSHWLNSPPDPYTTHCFLLYSLSKVHWTAATPLTFAVYETFLGNTFFYSSTLYWRCFCLSIFFILSIPYSSPDRSGGGGNGDRLKFRRRPSIFFSLLTRSFLAVLPSDVGVFISGCVN